MTDATCCNCGFPIPDPKSRSINVAADERLKQEREISRQQQLLDQAKIRSLEKKIFDLNQDLIQARNDSIRFQEMRDENVALSKDILVLGEMYNKVKEKLEAIHSNHFVRSTQISERNKLKCLERELEREKLAADNRTRERDWFKGRCNELEELLHVKESALDDCRRSMKTQALEMEAKLEATSDRINALISIKKQLSDHIRQLLSKNKNDDNGIMSANQNANGPHVQPN